MAIILSREFPTPNRDAQPIRRTKDDDGVLDIGWCEGLMSDGRPFRVEMWAQDGMSLITIFFSCTGLENESSATLEARLIREGLFSYRADAGSHFQAVPITDDAGQPMWSANVVVGNEDETYLDRSPPVWAYTHGAPNTSFRS